jgi:hypothetical protein
MIALLLALAAPAFAGGQEVGNGGDAVVCRDAGGNITSAELLDFYEARVLRGIDRDLGDPSLSVDAKTGIVVKRLAPLSPVRVDVYTMWLKAFMDNAQFLSGVQLVEVPDSDHLAFPKDCKVEQLAIQKEPEFPEDKRYTVNKDIWDRLDNDSRAGLMLHEIIYREAIAAGAKDSVGARYLNSRLCSHEADTFTMSTFVDILVEAGFLETDFDGREYLVRPDRPMFWDDGKLQSGTLAHLEFWKDPDNQEHGIHGVLAFWPDGSVRQLQFAEYVQFQDLTISPASPVKLLRDGTIQSATLSGAQRVSYSRPAYLLEAEPGQQGADDYVVNFFDNGSLESCTRCRGWAKTRAGDLVLVRSAVLLDDQTLAAALIDGPSSIRLDGIHTPLQIGSKLMMDTSVNADADLPVRLFTPELVTELVVGPRYIDVQGGTEVDCTGGKVTEATLARDTTFPDPAFGSKLIVAGTRVRFNEDGSYQGVVHPGDSK